MKTNKQNRTKKQPLRFFVLKISWKKKNENKRWQVLYVFTVELNVIKKLSFPDIWNSVITYHWQAGNFLFLKETYKFGNHDPANLLYALSPAHW